MKAVLLTSYGDVDQLVFGDATTPEPGPGEVLLRLHASAVNPFDLYLRQGYFAEMIPLPLPAILGGDAAGVIAKLGAGVSGWSVGERVVADFWPNGRGAHAEYGVVPATSLARLPDALSFEQGAALVKAGLTGRQTVAALGIQAGDRVLVSGALGSVGRAAVQYLQELGVQPVAGVRPERLEEARTLAGEAVDITVAASKPDFDFAISAAAPVAGNLISHVRDGGTIASIVPVPEGANATGRVTIRELVHQTEAATLDAVVDAAVRGDLIIPIAQTYGLDQLGDAHAAVAAGAPGKVVLKH
ncbi:NADP-dependent oxidoreductase [Burkholderia seminalis]|uniref:NADP-dependent oxidoreductase n=1 Tax=Burkholderia seminalis TaxID=488731 RepID=UPI0026536091|nr:NADP-dependent oxidoreductase [Burkholderia seminalis]MDN7591450.1 NADP-dependent oxidoreductase [Burkholderia seminalis]